MMRQGQPPAQQVPMARRQAALFHDLLNTWRFVGAAIWCHGALLAAHMACAVILSPFTHTSPLAMLGWRGLLLHALQMGVLMAHRRTLSASEAAPPQIPKLPFNGSAWIAPLLARLVLRDRKLSSAAASAWLLGATAACAVAYTYLYPSIALQGTTLQWSLVLGISVALTYTLQHLGRCRDVLSFPVLQRHRYFQLRSRLPQVVTSAVKVSVSGLVVALLLRQAPFPGTAQLLSTCVSISMCVLGWLLGHTMLDIVFSERLRLMAQAEAPFDALVSYGLSSSDGLVQDLTLMDVAALVEEKSSAAAAARQAIAFADETGRLGWTSLGGFLVGELRDLTTQLAAALPASAGEGAGAGVGPQPLAGPSGRSVQWNAVSMLSSARASDTRRAQELAGWTLRTRFYRDGWCLRMLSALAAASHSEDRYGVLLLCDPNLADVATTLASTVLVLQQYGKMQSSLSGSASGTLAKAVSAAARAMAMPTHCAAHKEEVLAYALEDLARSCTYRVVQAFGQSLKAALKDAKQKPAYGTVLEVTGMLQGMLDAKE